MQSEQQGSPDGPGSNSCGSHSQPQWSQAVSSTTVNVV